MKRSIALGRILFVVSVFLLVSANVGQVYAAISPQKYSLSGATAGIGSCGTWGTLGSTSASQSISGGISVRYLCYATSGTFTPSSMVDNGVWTFHVDWSSNSYSSSSTFTFALLLSTTRTTLGTSYGSATTTFSTSSGNKNITIPVTSVPTSSGYYLQLEIHDPGSVGSGHSITLTTSTYLVSPSTMTTSYVVYGGGSPTAPTLTYTQGRSTGRTLTLTTSPQTVSVDPGTLWSISPNPLTGSGTSERWYSSQTLSGTFPSSCSYSSPCLTMVSTFYHQYLQLLSYSVAGGGSPTAPTYAANRFGSSTPQVLTTTPTGYWYDSASSWSVTPNPLGGSTSTEQWITSQSTSGTISSAQTLAFSYQHQYLLTMTVSPSGAGATSPAVGTSWQNAGTTPTICATANTGYVFSSWTGSGSGSFTGISNPAGITMNAAITETANFVAQVSMTVSYSVSGGGSGYSAPIFNYVQGGQSKTYTLTGTATQITLDSGSTWSVTPNPLSGSTSSERWQSSQSLSGTASTGTYVFTFYHQYLQTLSYSVVGGGAGYSAPAYTANQFGSSFGQVLTTSATGYWFDNGASWTVTNPLSGSTTSEQWITSQSTSGAISSAQTIAFSYRHQYYLTMLAGTGGSVTPSSGWRNSEANVTITANPNGGYALASWTCTGTGCYAGTANPSWVIMNAIITETANFNSITIRIDNRTLSTSSGGANMTTPQSVNPTVEYWLGAGVYDSQSGTDVQSVTLDLYRTGHAVGTFDKSFVYSFRWVANGWGGTPSCSTSPGCWQELQSSGWVASSFNYLVSSDSSVTTISGSVLAAKWQFAIKLDQLAVYTTNGAGLWNFKVTAVSKSNGNPTGARAGTFDVNLLISITAPGNMNWGTVAAGSVNITATGMPVYTTYTANAIVNITVYGSGDPVSQYGDSFPLSYIYVAKTSNPANNDGVALSTSSKVFYSSLPLAANSNLPMYWFISTPSPFTPGSYTFTYYETIQLQSMQL